jgi:hypothetical protein
LTQTLSGEWLCLDCYNDDLREDVEEDLRLARERSKSFNKAEVPHGTLATVRTTSSTSESGSHYLRIEFRVPNATNLTRIFETLPKALDHHFDRAFDIVVSIENGNTVLTIRLGDREQDWMTIGDIAVCLTERLGHVVTQKTVREQMKAPAQRRDNPLWFQKGHSKMTLIWRPYFEEWFEEHKRSGRRLGKRENPTNKPSDSATRMATGER